jgi:hypothetical protein
MHALTNHLLTTYQPLTDYLPTTYNPPTNYLSLTSHQLTFWPCMHLPTTYWLLTNHLLTTYQPLTGYLPTTYRLLTNHLQTTYQPLTDYLPTNPPTYILTMHAPTNHLLTTYQPPTINHPPTYVLTIHLPTTYWIYLPTTYWKHTNYMYLFEYLIFPYQLLVIYLLQTSSTWITLPLNFSSDMQLPKTKYIEDITRWLEDMNFIFKWWKRYFTSERSE